MLHKWYHFSSQLKSVLIATFKAFHDRKSFAKCMQVSADKNKFTVKEFLQSVNIKYLIEYHGWSMGWKFLILQQWILKKVLLSFHSRYLMLWVERKMKEMKEKFPILTKQCKFDEPEEVNIVQFWQQKKAVKWRINAHTWSVWACYLGSRERLLHLRITGITLDSDILLCSHYKNIGSLNEV